eukprot:scaffold2318_cov396-Prasinococcus_capsulatus_cf.AAC.13
MRRQTRSHRNPSGQAWGKKNRNLKTRTDSDGAPLPGITPAPAGGSAIHTIPTISALGGRDVDRMCINPDPAAR